MTEYEAFLRAEAQRRGIDPDKAVVVANAEGGLTEPARRGTFDTGSSWWAFQLHYGGAGYERYGAVAGMGNSFTALTGWQPGDPAAWRDAMRYALDAVKRGGWGPWYGAAARGITGFDGVNRTFVWNGTPADEWDYRKQTKDPAYNPDQPAERQVQDWACSIRTATWVLKSLGIKADAGSMQDEMVPQYVNSSVGLLDARGYGLAEAIKAHLPADQHSRVHVLESLGWDNLKAIAGRGPVALGGRTWGHWTAVRKVNPDGTLALANPAPGFKGVGDSLSRDQWDQLGPFSAVWVQADSAPAEQPPTVDLGRLRADLADKSRRLDEAVSNLGYASGDVADAAEAIARAATALASTLRTLKPPAA